MLFRTYKPAPPLSAYIEKLWLYQGYTPTHARERVLPNGTMELVINLREDAIRIYDRQNPDLYRRHSGSVICGIHSQFFVIDTDEQASVIGVHFKPGGTFPFFKEPAADLHNLHVSLDNLWGNQALDLREQQPGATPPQARFHVLERYLLARLARHQSHHP